MNEKYTGALPEDRSPEERDKDWSHEEIFGFASLPAVWEQLTDLPQYPNRNQDGSGACGAFSGVVVLGRNQEKDNGTFLALDPAFIYQKRKNRPDAGMNMIDLFEIMRTVGAPADPDLSSDGKGDKDLDTKSYTPAQTEEAKVNKGDRYVFVRKDMEEVARIIQQGHTPVLLLRCQYDEWTTDPHINYPDKRDDFQINHFVPAPVFGIRNNKEVIAVLDSWGTSYGQRGWRFIDRDFLEKRVETIGYVVDLPDAKPDNKPHYTFNKFLTYGLRKDIDVVALQEILKYEDCLDAKVPSTGNFLNLTRLGVMKLQRKHKIASEADIVAADGNARTLTIAWLNKNYGYGK